MPQPSDCHDADTLVLVALGSNVTSHHGSPPETLLAALSALEDESLRVVARSRLYATPCFPPGAGPDFVNGAALLATTLDPQALLDRMHAVERAFGRERRVRWSSRTLDLDLLDFGGRVLPDVDTFSRWCDLPVEAQQQQAPEQLILPHPRLQDRAFVLVPLADVAPDWRHPVFGRSVAEMLAALPEEEKAAIRPI
ncbi:2-amino-4-hydroxy-6-hydroxymethyldihydropteridine diphosphokinase [Actibacterium sp. D379-3]